jgi:hypothetical protein
MGTVDGAQHWIGNLALPFALASMRIFQRPSIGRMQ